jgi:hypothetical protein
LLKRPFIFIGTLGVVAGLMLFAFSAATGGTSTAYGGNGGDETETVTNGDDGTGTATNGDDDGTASPGAGTATTGAGGTPTTGAGGTPTSGAGGTGGSPTAGAGGASGLPQTGTGAGGSDAPAWLAALGMALALAGGGAVLAGMRRS